MKKIISIIFIILFFYGCSSSSSEQAQEFSLKIIETYFTKNCDFFYDSLADEFYRIERGILVKKDSGFGKDGLCLYYLDDNAIRGLDSFKDYINKFEPKILKKEEFESEFGRYFKSETFQIEEDDYLFIGFEPKEGIDGSFIFDDYYLFLIRKIDNNWKIIAIQ